MLCGERFAAEGLLPRRSHWLPRPLLTNDGTTETQTAKEKRRRPRTLPGWPRRRRKTRKTPSDWNRVANSALTETHSEITAARDSIRVSRAAFSTTKMNRSPDAVSVLPERL